jgi:hypothetical protein
MIEAGHLGNSRQGATKVGGAGRRLAAWPFLSAASAVLYLAPHIVPAARDGTGGPSICATPSPSLPW